MAAAQRGDQAAFGRLVESRWAGCVRLARSIVGDLDAEDVAQEASLACWRKLSQLSDPGRFDSWLMRIVFTRAVRRARWQRLRNLVLWDPASAGLRSASAGLPAASAGLRGDAAGLPGGADSNLFVWEILRRLPPRQRAVLHLTVVEGMTDSEIGATLGLRPGSVRAHRRRARERVQAACRADPEVRPTSHDLVGAAPRGRP